MKQADKTISPMAYSVEQAVKASPLSRSSLYRAMRSGELKIRKYGRRTIIMAEDLRRFLEGGTA